jgi:ABC-type lipoprotein export system ATPase subunit
MGATGLLAVENVCRAYDGGRVLALDGVTLTIAPGGFVAIRGPSGSGKSTLLNLLGGLDQPTSGSVFFEGRAPAGRAAWTALRRISLGHVFQSFNLLATMSARENVELAMFGVVRHARERSARALELLDRVGMAHRFDHLPHELSVGERQRVAIARAIANRPRAILADEPTGNLDTASATAVLALLEEIHERDGTALLVVTHDEAVAARARRQVLIRDGKVVADAGQ